MCRLAVPFAPKLQSAGHTAGHQMQGRICRKCRSQLMRYPQLVAAITSELRDSGHQVSVSQLSLAPIVTDPNGCRLCGQPPGQPHHRRCDALERA